MNKENSIPEQNSFWIWNYKNNERLLLAEIYKYFINSWKMLSEHGKYNDLTVCGIGISRLDLPYFLARCIYNSIDSKVNLFTNIQKVRILDLENVTIPHFSTTDSYIYSKTKDDVYRLFLNSIPKSSTLVWELFENKNYELIKKNNEEKLSELDEIYGILLKCGVTKRMRKIYKKETFEKLIEYINDEKDKKIVEDNFLYNKTDKKWCLNVYEVDMDMQKKFIDNINLKIQIINILDNAYTLYKQSEGD